MLRRLQSIFILYRFVDTLHVALVMQILLGLVCTRVVTAVARPCLTKFNVNIGNEHVEMELDTGASRFTISECVYEPLFSDYALNEVVITLIVTLEKLYHFSEVLKSCSNMVAILNS